MQLQRATGNHATSKVLAPQARLAISEPGDALEVEADQVADRVMRMTEPTAKARDAAASAAGDASKLLRKCAQCEDEERTLHRQTAGAPVGGMASPPIVHEVLQSPGQPLDATTRAFMEPWFGYDFSSVRVHTDARAQQSARDVRAHAYTVGSDIVFAADQYAPHTQPGRRLLAHELTHVAQQSTGRVARLIQRDGDDQTSQANQGDQANQQGDGDGPTAPPPPPAPPPVSAADAAAATPDASSAGGASATAGGSASSPQITLETGNSGAGFINNWVHQQICVDGYSPGARKRCFSFAAGGVQLPQFSSTWLGWSSTVVGAFLEGQVYEPGPVAGASIAGSLSPTPAQASNWLNYMTSTRLGLTDGYSVARHNCRTFSQWELRDAPSHY